MKSSLKEILVSDNNSLYVGLVIAVAAFLVYANSLGNGFVWDDDVVIVGNAAIRGSWFSLFSGIDVARSTELLPYYRPLTLLSFLMEERVHGLAPFLVRLFNVLLHSANTFLVFQLARTLFDRSYAPLLVALLFAVHPFQSEGVDFNSGGRNTLMACFFVLAAYLVHNRSIQRKRYYETLLGAVLFIAGLLSKETAFAALPIILFLELRLHCKHETPQLKAVAVRLLPYITVALLYLAMRQHALANAGVHVIYFPDYAVLLHNNLFILPRYLLNIVWPAWLSAYYFVPDDLSLLLLPLLLAWGFIVAAVVWLCTGGRSHASLFGVAWAIAFWLPASGIIPFASAPLADRYVYVSVIGLWIVAADQLVKLLDVSCVSVRRYVYALAAVLLLALSITTVTRNRVWQDDVRLFTDVIGQYPEEAWGHHNLGCAYLDKIRNLDLAEREFEKALKLNPLFPLLRTQMAYIRLLKGDFSGALQHYTAALMLNPNDGEAHLNRAVVLERFGRFEEALFEYRQFLAATGMQLPASRPMAEARILEISKQLEGKVK